MGDGIRHLLQFGPIPQRERAWRRIHKAQRTQPYLFLKDKWCPGVETDMWRPDNQCVGCKPRIDRGIFDNEDLIAEDGEVAEGHVSG